MSAREIDLRRYKAVDRTGKVWFTGLSAAEIEENPPRLEGLTRIERLRCIPEDSDDLLEILRG
jgi:hypothetical protein